MNTNMQPDNELLRQYASAKSEAAFAELVKRHVNLVYSTALRQVGGDAHLAHDVAQTVFTDLARKAASLSKRESLTGWLYTSAYFAAGKMARTEIRRREREEQFMRDPALTSSDADWEKLRPILDSAMHGLKESDREAVLLRYFENRPYAEVGAQLGINENTARMRVERALEKLRATLAKRAITTTVTLASVISANAVQVAPSTLAATLTNASLAAAGAGTSFALFKIMTLTQLKVGAGAIAVAGVATTMVLQHQTQQQLRGDNDSLRQQIAQLRADNEETSNRLAAANSPSLSSDQMNELLRLRGEVSGLRSQTNQLAQLRDQNQQMREAFAKLAQQNQREPDPEQAFAMLEINTVKESVLGMILYAEEHGSQFPTNFNQADSYYKGPQSLSTNFGRFEMVYQGSWTNVANPSSAIVVREVQPWMRNGKWNKAYGFADGHAEIHSEANGNFDSWEQERVPVLKNQ